MDRQPHILNASSNMLGVALLIVAGLHISSSAAKTLADEVAWVAAMLFMASCFGSYLSLRNPAARRDFETWADRAFILGQLTLFGAVVVLAAGKAGL